MLGTCLADFLVWCLQLSPYLPNMFVPHVSFHARRSRYGGVQFARKKQLRQDLERKRAAARAQQITLLRSYRTGAAPDLT